MDAGTVSEGYVRVLTLNCWGLKYVSKDRVKRISAIASFLATAPYDIVCLQELWVKADFKVVHAAISRQLPFVKVFHSGAVGAGLVIFSRFRIVAATLQSYSLNGSPLDLQGADWFSGKSAASVLVRHPLLGHLQIFNTHLFSEGGDDGPEYLRAHRLVNAWEFSKLVKQSAEIGHHVIAAGDFNSMPHTLPMTVVREHAGLHDTWATLHQHPTLDSDMRGALDPADALSLYGFTYDSPLDSYASGLKRKDHSLVLQGKRLDYIFFRNPETAIHTEPRLVPIECRVILSTPVPGYSFSYSDHFGVEATFKIIQGEITSKQMLSPSLKSTPMVASTAAPTDSFLDTKSGLSHNAALAVIDALKVFLDRSNARARGQLRVFGASSLLLLADLIGTGWSSKGYLTPLFVFIGSVATWVATTMFYVGLLYGKWEAKALQNAIEDLELYVLTLGNSM